MSALRNGLGEIGFQLDQQIGTGPGFLLGRARDDQKTNQDCDNSVSHHEVLAPQQQQCIQIRKAVQHYPFESRTP